MKNKQHRTGSELELRHLRLYYESGGSEAVNKALVEAGFERRSSSSICKKAMTLHLLRSSARKLGRPRTTTAERLAQLPDDSVRKCLLGFRLALVEHVADLAKLLERYEEAVAEETSRRKT